MSFKSSNIGGKRSNLLKKAGFAAGGLAVLLVIAWFVCTSNAFFKSFILPRVGKSMNAKITVEGASVSPFSSVTLRKLTVHPDGAEPLFQADEIRARYSLWSILRGNTVVQEVVVEAPRLTIVENADGTSNLDPLLKSEAFSASDPTKEPAKSSGPTRVDVRSVSIKNAAVFVTRKLASGGPHTAEISGFNFSLSDLRNGGTAKIDLGGALKLNQPATSNTPANTLAATMKAAFQVALDASLVPQTAKADGDLTVNQTTGDFADLSALAIKLTAEMTPTEIKQSSINVTKSGQPISFLTVAGPFDSAKREGKLTVTVSSINRQVLNLVGAVGGLDFGNTVINSTNTVTIANNGNSVSLAGLVHGRSFTITKDKLTTPSLDLRSDYNLSVDQGKQTALIQSFSLSGTQASRPLLRAELTRPMKLDWGAVSNAVDESDLKLALTGLNVSEWSAFLGTNLRSGVINADLGIAAQQAGRKMAFTVTAKATGLAADLGEIRLTQGGLEANFSAGLDDFKRVTLNEAKATLQRGSEKLVSVEASGSVNAEAGAMKLTASAESTPAGIKLFTGQTVSGPPLNAALTLDATFAKQILDLRTCRIGFTPTAKAAKNELALSGKVNLTRSDAITGALKLVAESLDLTAYWNAFAGGSSPTVSAAPESTVTEAAPSIMALKVEPAAFQLPFKNFTAEASVGRLYLGELEITNTLSTLRLDGGSVVLKPVQLSLNGAPVSASADLNLGVPGYQYDVMLNAPNVSLAPLVNAFMPARRGQLAGQATASARFKGAGMTGASLQKNLVGQFDLTTTNLNLSVTNVRASALRQIIGVIVNIPNGIRNPAEMANKTFSSLTSLFTGERRGGGEWSSEVTQYPIDVLVVHGKAGGGKIELAQASAQSLAFRADTEGAISIAPVLNDSPMLLPVHIAMKRSLTESIGLSSTNDQPGVRYVRLPDFVTVKGTLGSPVIEKRYLLLAEAVLRLAPNLANKAKDALKSVEGLFGLGPKDQTNKPGTNQTQPLDDLRNLFRRPPPEEKKGK